MLVLLVFGGWVAVAAWWVVSRREAPSESIGSFRRQLGTLERRTPGLVVPAHQFGRQIGHAPARGAAPLRTSMASYHRASVQKRRRDILSGLSVLSALTLALGFVPSLRLLLVLHVVSDVCLAAYVTLLVQLRNTAAEREMAGGFGARGAARRPAPRVTRTYEVAYEDDLDAAYDLQPALIRRTAG